MVGQGGAGAKSLHTHPNGTCGSSQGVFLFGGWPHLEGSPSHCDTLPWVFISLFGHVALADPASRKPPVDVIFLNIHRMLAVFLRIPASGVRGICAFLVQFVAVVVA